MSIVLVGLPASGKTTVGQDLAAKLGVGFVDTDALVEDRAGKLIREIFAEQGEAKFRELEEEAAGAALGSSGVISLGGGAVMTPAIRQMLAGHQVVWLDLSVTTLTRRAGMSLLRPLLLGDLRVQMAQLASERLPFYEQVATWRVDAEQSVDEVVSQILALVRIVSQVIRVRSDHPYDVVIGRGVVAEVPGMLEGAGKVAILHPPVMAEQAARVAGLLPDPVLVPLPDGEEAKTAEVLNHCWRTLAQSGLTRSDAVIGMGGGSTTDLAGFVAATFLRGVACVNLPTTVLGMADAAVGGKTGINLPEGKNLVGAFHEPRAVVCDLDLLAGLPLEEVRSGLGEIIKCGFIADPEILHEDGGPPVLCDTRSEQFADALTRAIRVKAEVVSADFRENSTSGVGREALNYGHTLGHAIEKLEGFTWAHGHAVAVGMVFAAEVASRLGMIQDSEVALHREVLESVGLPTTYSGASWADLRATMSLDKKSRGSHLRLVLLEGIGRVAVVADVDEELLSQAFSAIGG